LILKTFQDLGISEALVKGLEELGITKPTSVQKEVIPHVLAHRGDLITQAQTGTGKTAAFGLPMLERIIPHASKAKVGQIDGLVVAPTRELAKQIGKQLFKFTKHAPEKIFVETITGGDNMDRQIAALRRPTHIVVGTPGRIMDLIQREALNLSKVRYLVLDEADEMLSLGFKKELEQFFQLTAKSRKNTWLFSATIPDGIQELIEGYMEPTAHRITIDKAHVVNRDIKHRYIICDRTEKLDRISEFLEDHPEDRGVIFCRTIAGSINLAKELTTRNFSVGVLHGDLAQIDRDKVMRAFKKERVQYLVTTDVSARGIDVAGLAFVIHHQLPEQTEYYTHRSGRTARAGKKGVSITLIEPRERAKLERIGRELGVHFREMR
jgi:ATP-dependent RNA helicase DeaD